MASCEPAFSFQDQGFCQTFACHQHHSCDISLQNCERIGKKKGEDSPRLAFMLKEQNLHSRAWCDRKKTMNSISFQLHLGRYEPSMRPAPQCACFMAAQVSLVSSASSCSGVFAKVLGPESDLARQSPFHALLCPCLPHGVAKDVRIYSPPCLDCCRAASVRKLPQELVRTHMIGAAPAKAVERLHQCGRAVALEIPQHMTRTKSRCSYIKTARSG